MELRHLKMINEVAECKSLTKAAERLFLSQSALSHQLKEVESYFNAQLFIRQKKQMLLTREGEIILASGKKILDEVERTRCAIKQVTDKEAGEIRFSSECYTSYHWLSNMLREFNTVYPRVEIKIEMEATRNALPYLLEDKIDVGVFEDNKNKKIQYTPLFSDEFYVIVPVTHAWAQRKWIEIDQLYKEAYIMYNIPTEKSTIYQLIFKNNYPPKVYQLPLTEVIFQMVKAGIGFSILPNWVALPYLKTKELAAVRITRKGIKRSWYAGVLKDKVLPPYVDTFIQMLARNMKACEEHKLLRVA
jgi:LysR family transcriptional regulator, regulator for metE and metH